MDADGYADLAGIACAEGGTGWWRHPGRPGGEWLYNEIDGSLEGPKDLFAEMKSSLLPLFSVMFLSPAICMLEFQQVLQAAGFRKTQLLFLLTNWDSLCFSRSVPKA